MVIDEEPTGSNTKLTLDREHDAALVQRCRAGDQNAFGELYDAWGQRVFSVAHRIVHDDEAAADIVQDAFLSAWRKLDTLSDPAAFGGWILRIARNAALKRADRDSRSQAVDDAGLAMIEHQGTVPTSAPTGFDVFSRIARADDPAAVAGDREVIELVEEVLAALGSRDAEVLDLQLRHHLSPSEIGQVLGLNRNASNQLCHRVRARFAEAFGARMLWRPPGKGCDALAAELLDADVSTFGIDAVRITNAHLRACPRCEADRATRLSPTTLFAAVPLVPFAEMLRSRVANALSLAGVPMSGSAYSPSPTIEGAEPGTGDLHPTDSRVRGPARRRRALAACVAAALILLVATAWLVARNRAEPARVARHEPIAEGTAPPKSPDTAREAPGPTVTHDDRPSPTTGLDPTSVPPETATTSTAAPSTSVPPTTRPWLEEFGLAPQTPQPAVWDSTSGPVLTWRTQGVDHVMIRTWYDDGTHGPQLSGSEAVDVSGTRAVCPGTRPTPTSCTAATGHYSFELVAVDADGQSVSAQERPGFDVLPPVIL